MKTFIIFALALFAAPFAHVVPLHFHSDNLPYFPDLESSAALQQPGILQAKIGRIIEGCNLIWGENVGWVNLKTAHTELKIGSNILAGWIWLENCGWICLGEGHPLDGKGYSNRSASDWGVNNNGRGKLSGYAWSEVTGWISFRTIHSRVYLDKSGQFYGYAWGENAGWMHFGPGRTVQYIAKTDPGPWRDIGRELVGRFAGSPDDSELRSGDVSITGLRENHQRYDKYAFTVCLLRIGKDDSCACSRSCDTPVYIASFAKLSPIRAPPHFGY